VQEKFPPAASLPALAAGVRGERIRVGYFSADFRNHATMYLMAGLFERHDRSRFELSAWCFGPPAQDEMRGRLQRCCERLIEVGDQSDRQVAERARELQLDIAVDLKGFTQDSRPGIFACRAAPLQLSYLGYPGTMGAPYMDYLIADATLIPPASQIHYSEKILYLPDSYQVNDAQRPIAQRLFTREELGLPRSGFIFCCFNNNYKITPQTFAGWMRILQRVPGSVLWLLEDNARAAHNLREQARGSAVGAERLIFAKRMPLSEHLARHRAADLFLDTLPCNAHTTASDALWAGLPLLTCAGEAFAGRVAASLLNAIRLPELITLTQSHYEELAVALASDAARLAALRERLAHNRLTTPLFDTALYATRLERAYSHIYERQQARLPNAHIHLEP
jgi:predicted O-linked N-acetylglucosamine transferase (SPINDLY family)